MPSVTKKFFRRCTDVLPALPRSHPTFEMLNWLLNITIFDTCAEVDCTFIEQRVPAYSLLDNRRAYECVPVGLRSRASYR